MGEAVYGARSSGPVQPDVVMAGAAEGSRHQQRGRQSPQREERQPTERPRLSGKGRVPPQISKNINYMVSHSCVSVR